MSLQDAAVWYLRVEQEQTDGVCVLTVRGRVSSLTAAELDSALASAIGSPASGFVLDLSAVDYISSPGIRALQTVSMALAQSDRPFVLCGLQDAVSVVFALAGLDGVLAIELSRDAAVVRATSTLRAGERAC